MVDGRISGGLRRMALLGVSHSFRHLHATHTTDRTEQLGARARRQQDCAGHDAGGPHAAVHHRHGRPLPPRALRCVSRERASRLSHAIRVLVAATTYQPVHHHTHTHTSHARQSTTTPSTFSSLPSPTHTTRRSSRRLCAMPSSPRARRSPPRPRRRRRRRAGTGLGAKSNGRTWQGIDGD